MAQRRSDIPDDGGRFVRLDDGDMYVVTDGPPSAPAVLLLHNAASSVAAWDAVVPALADQYHVIRVDLLGGGRSTPAVGGYDVPTQARRVGTALAKLGVRRAMVVGHSSGCTVATALAEQQPDTVSALALIDMGPDPQAKIPESRLLRTMLTRFPGRLLWTLRTESTVRKSMRTAVNHPVEIPAACIDSPMSMTHHAFVSAMREPLAYLTQQSLPDRLAPLGLPLLVIFGAEDRRWHPSSADAYRTVPGAHVALLPDIGHTPIMEAPSTTTALLLTFATKAQQTQHP